jgi:hypothetical protein
VIGLFDHRYVLLHSRVHGVLLEEDH